MKLFSTLIVHIGLHLVNAGINFFFAFFLAPSSLNSSLLRRKNNFSNFKQKVSVLKQVKVVFLFPFTLLYNQLIAFRVPTDKARRNKSGQKCWTWCFANQSFFLFFWFNSSFMFAAHFYYVIVLSMCFPCSPRIQWVADVSEKCFLVRKNSARIRVQGYIWCTVKKCCVWVSNLEFESKFRKPCCTLQ